MTTHATPTTDSARLGHIESQVSSVAASLDSFIKESASFRVRTEKEQTQIWAAIREQGDNLRNAVEKLSMRGQISWGMIVTTGGLVLALIGAVAGVGNIIMESRIQQLYIRDAAQGELLDARLETERVRAEFLLRMCDENHADLKQLGEWHPCS